MTNKIKPHPVPLFKTADSLDDAMSRIKASLPITSENEVHALVMMYHNSLLAELAKAS